MQNFVPGFLCVLHTFGRPLEWNPHYIHCLLSEGGFWHTVNYFNYSYLRKSFQTVLLNHLEKRIGPSFKTVKSTIYKTLFFNM
ncbi:transposase [Faecalicatena orotica]|uniref:transposase n=1 Tax=Faecalicatena orotica TaxID=1544 RepID=UPI002FE60899